MAKIKCAHCGTKFNGNFCPSCSAPAPEQPKKKKGWVLPVIVVVILVLLVSCFGGGGKDEDKQPSAAKTDTTAKSDSVKETSEPETAPAVKAVTISEQELYNKDGIVIVAKKLQDSLFGPEITVAVENNSTKNILVTAQSLSVNDYMLSASGLYSNVAAGKKDNAQINLMSSELRQSGISTIGEVSFYLNISDSDSYSTLDTTGLITLKTSADGTFTQEIDDSGDEVYSANNLRVVCKGLKKDAIWDGTVVFYLENNSGRAVSIYAENVSVNGYMADVGMYTSLRPGTRMVDGMYLLNTELESIDDITDIEFTLRMFDSDSYQSIATSDVIRLEFNK